MTPVRMVHVAAAISFAAGIILTAYAGWQTPQWREQISKRVADLGKMKALEQSLAGDESAVQRYESLGMKHPIPLAEVLSKAGIAETPDIRSRESKPTLAGWSLRTMDVRVEEAPLSKIGRIIEQAESRRPPWRLTECSVSASDKIAGHGRITLVFEALEKGGP
jgi:hypothetical protein